MIPGFKFPIGIYALRAKKYPIAYLEQKYLYKRLIKTLALARRAFISIAK